MKNCVGQPVTGSDFFDRKKEQRDFWRILENDSVLLLAPRRIGKTSLMRRLEETATKHGFVAALDLSVADCTDELAFVQKLYEETLTLKGGAELIDKISTTAGRLFKRVDNVSLPGGFGLEFTREARAQWRELASTLIHLLQNVEGKHLISIDELPIFVLKLLKDRTREEAAKDFLNWFRELRQATPHIRWLLAGSIGLDSITARMNMHDVINDLHPMDLGAFDKPTSHRFLMALAKGYGIDLAEEVRETIIERIGWTVPYYLQVVFSELLTLSDSGRTPINIPMVEMAFQELLSPRRKSYFDYWRQRLHDELGEPDAKYCILLLNAICKDQNGASKDILSQILSNAILDIDERENKLRYLLDVLESDGYLIVIDGRYRFRILLLREFWQQRVAS